MLEEISSSWFPWNSFVAAFFGKIWSCEPEFENFKQRLLGDSDVTVKEWVNNLYN